MHNLSVGIGKNIFCQNVNDQFEPGKFYVLLGANGCGKTSFLMTLAGLRKVNQGVIQLDNVPLTKVGYKQRAKKIGVLLQEQNEYLFMTVINALQLARHPHMNLWQSHQVLSKTLIKILDHLDLISLKNRIISSLSGGEQQRVYIAMLLAQDPEVFLLDEPSNHLDVRYQMKTLDYLHEMTREHNKTVIAVMHDFNLAYRYADVAMLMYPDGELVIDDKVRAYSADNLSRLYNCPIRPLQVGNEFWWTAENSCSINSLSAESCKPIGVEQ